MKSDVMQSIVLMEPKVLRQLVTEVKETVAMDVEFAKQGGNSFGVVNLWNIRKNSRTAGRGRGPKRGGIVTGISY